MHGNLAHSMQAEERGAQDAAFCSVRGVGATHAAEDSALLGFTQVKFSFGELAGIGPRPRFGGKAPQRARPAAIGIVETVRVRPGEEVEY